MVSMSDMALTYSFLDIEKIKYKGQTKKINDFIQENQLLDEGLWKTFVEQFSFGKMKKTAVDAWKAQTNIIYPPQGSPDEEVIKVCVAEHSVYNCDSNDNGWRGEYWGKMMRGACLTYRYTRNRKLLSILKKTALDMLSVQDKFGRFSTYIVEKELNGWDMWGRKYVMVGFLYFYEICDNQSLKKKIVKALKEHADYLVARIGDEEGKVKITDTSSVLDGLNSCSILEPFVKLYNITKESRYLNFAEYIISTGFTKSENLIALVDTDAKMPFEFTPPKAYEMMSCFQGLLEYGKATKNEKLLKTAIKFFDKVYQTEMTQVGGLGCQHEMFNHSREMQTEYHNGPMLETCVTVTWLNCCFELLRFTGESKYADWIEASAVNAMYGAVNLQKNKKICKWILKRAVPLNNKDWWFPFDSYSPLIKQRRGIDVGGNKVVNQEGNFYGCCTCIGSAGTAISALYGCMRYEKGYVLNSFEPALLKLKTPTGKNFSVHMQGNIFTGNGNVKMRFRIAETEKLAFKVRIPIWSKNTSVLYNGRIWKNIKAGCYFEIEDEFFDGAVLEIRLDNSFEVVKQNGKTLIKKGPYVLARDERYGDNIDKDYKLIFNKADKPKVKKVKTGLFYCLGEYEVQVENGKRITMCDYASAGNQWDDTSANRISVWL